MKMKKKKMKRKINIDLAVSQGSLFSPFTITIS